MKDRIAQHTHVADPPVDGCEACAEGTYIKARVGEPRLLAGPNIGDRLSNGAWCLAARRTHREGHYTFVVLTFHSGAGAEAPFAVGRCSPGGEVNPITYDYFATLPYAMFNYTYERG